MPHLLAFVVGLVTVGIVSFATAQSDPRAIRTIPAAISPTQNASADQRLALVIGNGSYTAQPLKNPVNDARAIAKALESAGFAVLLRENLGQRGMVESVREFGDKLRPDGAGVFYFAGHGVQVRDRNYLLPVDADIQREDEIAFQSFDAAQVLEKMERARTRVNIMILDACRNNPFARSFRSATQGLAQMSAPAGTLIAFATAPNSVALDGTGQHGIYTKHLLEHLPTPNLAAEIMFRRVREGVVRETKKAQTPWESSSLQGDFVFATASGAVQQSISSSPPVGPSQAALPTELAIELAFWESIRSSTSRGDFEAYLRQYPNGRFVDLANGRLAGLTPSPPSSHVATAPASTTQLPDRPGPLRALNPNLLPSIGDAWTYNYIDGFRRGVVGTIKYRVTAVTSEGIGETFSYSQAPRLAPEYVVKVEPEFAARQGLDFYAPDFSPYLQAFADLGKSDLHLPSVRRQLVSDGSVELRMRMIGKETVSVPAGKFEAIKIALEGRGFTDVRREPISSFVEIWYAPSVKRFVRFTAQSFQGNKPLELSTFLLTEFVLH